MPTRLGGIAVALTDIMWRLYERRYGDEAVRRVRKMERDLADARRMIDRYVEDLAAAEGALRVADAEIDDLRFEVAQWKDEATKWRIEAKAAKTLSENPFDECEWLTEKPTEPGYYWWRFGTDPAQVVRMTASGLVFQTGVGVPTPASFLEGTRWLPLARPKQPEVP